MKAPAHEFTKELLDLAHALGKEKRRLAILGEGNVSAKISESRFVVKASGSNLANLEAAQVTECLNKGLLALFDDAKADDAASAEALLKARVESSAAKPSVEAMFHAWLLTLPGINYVGHTHPVAVNALLCTAQAKTFAAKRLFPDEIVCCGAESVWVPYVDPGLPLARAIRTRVTAFHKRTGVVPRLILLQNHGLIALGGSPKGVLAATLMAVKAAEITLGALQAGGPVYLKARDVARIAGRSDEHYRQRALGI